MEDGLALVEAWFPLGRGRQRDGRHCAGFVENRRWGKRWRRYWVPLSSVEQKGL